MSRPVLTVEEASQTYESAMRNVLPGGPTVCPTCGTWKPTPYPLCFACNKQPSHLAAVVPITYSEHLRQMHTVLRNYKDGLDEAVRDYAIPRLAAILWRFLDLHEACLAMAADVTAFDLVTTVPSSTPERDDSTAPISACPPRTRGNPGPRWSVLRL